MEKAERGEYISSSSFKLAVFSLSRTYRLQVDDLVDMVQDEVAQCDIPVCPDPKYKAYRASYALRGLETLGKEFRSLHNKHFGLARHILKFLKQSAIGNPNTALRQFRNVVRVVYPNLPVRSFTCCS